MSLLKGWFGAFSKVSQKKTGGAAPHPISDGEVLARFVFDKQHIRKSPSLAIKPAAFLPNPKDMRTSVFRKDYMDESYYSAVMQKVSQARGGREIKATALVEATDVIAAGVKVTPEETEYKWHADIESWPEEKHERMRIAQELAAKSALEQ